MRRWRTLLPPSRALRRRGVTLDNIALVQASMLPHKARYQSIANRLPYGDVLIVLPMAESQEKQVLETAAVFLRAKGRHVTLLAAADIVGNQ